VKSEKIAEMLRGRGKEMRVVNTKRRSKRGLEVKTEQN
jgi:hypothetical protein